MAHQPSADLFEEVLAAFNAFDVEAYQRTASSPASAPRTSLRAALQRRGIPVAGEPQKPSAPADVTQVVTAPAQRAALAKPLPEDEEARIVRCLLAGGFSKNTVARWLGGSKTTAYRRIARALGRQ